MFAPDNELKERLAAIDREAAATLSDRRRSSDGPSEAPGGGFFSRIKSHITGVLDGSVEPRTPIGQMFRSLAEKLGALSDMLGGGDSSAPEPSSGPAVPPSGPQRTAPSSPPRAEPSSGPASPSVPAPETPNTTVPTTGPAAPASAAQLATEAMANGTATEQQIQTFEQATIQKLTVHQQQTGDKQLKRGLSIMNADGQISDNEYKVYQAIIEKSDVLKDLKLSGVTSPQDINTPQELGAAMAAVAAKANGASQVQGRG